MTWITALWLPILLSAVIVFVASSIIHMAPLWHRNDYPRLPDEERFRAAVGPLALPSGDYVVPRAGSMAEMKTPEFQKKFEEGPVLSMTIWPSGRPSMARNMVLWFLFSIVVSIFAAYVSGRALPPGTDYLKVFRFAGVTSFIGYSLALWEMSIWYRRAWSMTIKSTIDGLIYGLLTAGVFGWLWPR